MNEFFTILTTVGLAKIANATITETPIGITTMVVGDGNGSYYTPTVDQTSLRKEVWRGTVNAVETDVSNPKWIKIEGLIPSTVGGFTVREVGVIDGAGDLIAVGKYPATYKPTLDEGSSKDLILRMILEVSNASAVTLKVDPSVVMASKKYVDDGLNKKANSTDMQDLQKTVNEHKADELYQAAGGTATAITLNINGPLVNGYPMTFIASANNNGAATKINGKALYKPNTTTAPTLILGKAYSIWYSQSSDCFFIKASAEGSSTTDKVLAGFTFSNDNDTGLTGTIPSKDAQTYTPKTTNQTIASGQFLNGVQTILGDSDLIASNIKKGIDIFGILGTLDVASLGGRNVASGSITNGNGAVNFQASNGIIVGVNFVTVTGLTFKPSVILVYDLSVSSTPSFATYNDRLANKCRIAVYYLSSNNLLNAYDAYYDSNAAVINSSGFTLPVRTTNTLFGWVAYE